MKLEGRVALVTGAGRGIGRAISLAMAWEGAEIVVNDINGQAAEVVAQEVRALGRQALAVVADVTNSAQVSAMVQQAVAQFGKLDVLVNNAGYFGADWFMDTGEEDWDRMINLNLKAVLICCKAALSEMIPRGAGRIVNISSDAGRVGTGAQGAYSAAKGGVIAFTKTLAREMARYRINVNTVAPGVVDTDLTQAIGARNPRLVEGMAKGIPWRRLARPEDIAGAVVFLATDDAEYITGQTLSVNGGLVMI